MKRWKRFAIKSIILAASFFVLFVIIKGVHHLSSGWKLFQRLRQTFSPSLDFPIVGQRNIFFLETSCAVHDLPPANFTYESGLVLPPRAACAVEAAAAAHPRRPVFFVHTCPLDLEALRRGEVPGFAREVFALRNVFLWPVRFAPLFFGTPMEKLIEGASLRESKWATTHASYLLRHLLLWQYGGTYLDSDILMLKSFGDLRDFSCAASPSQITSGVLDFSWGAPGRLLAEACLNESLLLQPDSENFNVHGIVTRAMETVCGVKNINEMNAERCRGFRLVSASDIYPVPLSEWHRIFDESDAAHTMEKIKNSYAIHTWNKLSKHVPVETASNQAFMRIARKVCPLVVSTMGDSM